MTDRPVSSFSNLLTKRETVFLLIYFPMHVAILPLMLTQIQARWRLVYDSSAFTLVYYAIGVVLILIFANSYLRRSFYALCDRFAFCLAMAALGFLLYLLLINVIAVSEQLIGIQQENLNDTSISGMAMQDYGKTFALAVFLAPLVEEPLFRGMLFGSVRSRNRWCAYILTVLLFGLYHIWQLVAVLKDLSYLLLIIDYIPGGLVLCWVYDRTSCIWTPIALHMFINYLGMLSLVH